MKQDNLLFEITGQRSQPEIPGLKYTPNYISPVDEHALLEKIDRQPWLSDLKRRVQHYGYKYDYKARSITRDAYLGALPEWLSDFGTKFLQNRIFSSIPDQVIVNEYMPGQGISAHIDCVPCFESTIISLSLGSPCVMEFSSPRTAEKKEIVLERRSLVVLSGAARYEWMHAIPARKSDTIDGYKAVRRRRISLTFRKIIFT